MAEVKNHAQLKQYFGDLYTGEYIEKAVVKDFATLDAASQKIVKEMAKRGRDQSSMEKSLERIEKQASSLGYDVVYDVNEKTNEIKVILLDRNQDKDKVSQLKSAPKFSLSVGFGKRGGKGKMAAPKSYAPHIGTEGTMLLTQVEETLEGVSTALTKLKQSKKRPDSGRVQYEIKKAQKLAEQSIVTTEGYSIVDEEKFAEEMKTETSNARGTFVRTNLRLGGLIGEVIKKSKFTDKLNKARKLTIKETEKYNAKADALVTKYAAIYSQEGEKAADAYFMSAKTLKEDFKLTEDDIKLKLKEVKSGFGDFLAIPSTFGLSGDEALRTKKFSYVGNRDLAFRTLDPTGRHSSQTRNYLERSDRAKRIAEQKKRGTEKFIPLADANNTSYYKESGHQLYKKALITSGEKGELPEDLITQAYQEGINEYISEKLKKLRGSKRYSKATADRQLEMEKNLKRKILESIPSVSELGIMEDAGLMSESTAKEFESIRTVTATITDEQYQKLKDEAVERYKKLSDKAQAKVDVEEYTRDYVAKKALGRKNISNIEEFGGLEAGGDRTFQATETVRGGTAKTLSRYTGVRETDVAIPDVIFNKITEKIGARGADIISLAKKFKAEEIPGYFQGFLSAALDAGIKSSEEIVKDLNDLGFEASMGADGQIFINNADEAMRGIDWNKALNYLSNNLGILKPVEDASGAISGYEFAKSATMIADVINRADVYEPTKRVKTSYKELSGIQRDISEAMAGKSDVDKQKFESLLSDINVMYDPTQGAYGKEAQKARQDIAAILDTKSGSILKTYQTQKNADRAKDVASLKRKSYKKGGRAKRSHQYVISVGNGTGYTINANDIAMGAADYQANGGLLTEEEYADTVLGSIDKVKKEILAKDPNAVISVMVDPGTDFGFGMSFDDGGVSEGATGRFIVLPNIGIDTVTKDNETLYSLPSYNKQINSLIGSIREGRPTAGIKAQELTQEIFNTAHSSKGTLYQKAQTKRQGASTAGHITGISQKSVRKALKRGDLEAVKRLMSDIWVSKERMASMLSNKDFYTDAETGVYDEAQHRGFLTEALKYLYGDSSNEILGGIDFDDKDANSRIIDYIINAITDDKYSGKMKGLASIMNRYPSIAQQSTTFAGLHVSSGLKGYDIKVGAALTKFVNGDYDGDTMNLILGLWSSGMSFDAAAEMVERQKEKNYNLYKQMFLNQTVDKTAATTAEAQKLSDTQYMGLSALAAKFNKPYTGMFSNISTRIREGLRATGFDVIDASGNPIPISTEDDYVRAIRGKLVAGVGQILEQDSISAKKVEKRLDAARAAKGSALSPEEIEKEQQAVLHEFEELYAMMRNEDVGYEEIIDRMSDMGLFASDVTQISSTLAANISALLGGTSTDMRKSILNRLGITEEDLKSGILGAGVFKDAGQKVESGLFDPQTGKNLKIFAGEYGTGLATSRSYTPYMKQDTYEMLRYVKSIEDVNSVLKKTGEIINENKKAFNEYGETIDIAHSKLGSEAAQEQAKVVIAGKEGKAIERNANMYQQLSEKLEAAGDNYKAVNRLSTSELKSRLLPYGGELTTGIDEKTLNRVYRQIKGGKAFTKEELAAQFGVENEKALNSLFMGNLSTVRGNYVHNLAQGDTKGARKERAKLDKMFRVLGYSDEEISKTFDIYKTGAKNVKSITKQYGTSLGSEIPFIGMTSDGQYVVNARGDEFFVGERANPFYDKNDPDSDQKKTQKVFTAVDYKTHKSGKLEDSDIIQGVTYKTFLEDLRARLKNVGTIDQNLIDEVKADIDKGMKFTSGKKGRKERDALLSKITPEWLRALKESDVVQTEIVVVNPSTGSAQAYSVGADKDKFKVARDIVLSGDTTPLTTEEKASVKSVVKKRTDAKYFKPGVSSDDNDGSIEDKMKQTRSEASKIEGQQEFNKLLDQEYDIRKKIQALQHEINREQAKKGYTGDLEKDKEYLEGILGGIQTEQKALLDTGVDERAEKRKAKERELSYSEQLLSRQDNAKTMSEYEAFLDKTNRADQELVGIRAKALITTGAEKQLYEKIYTLKYNAVQTDKEQLKVLEELASKVDPTRVKFLKEQAKLNAELYRTQSMKQTRGATSIWDVMANDIRRATMRVADFGIAAKILNKIPQDIQKVIQYTKELDAAMTNIRVVTGASAEEAQTLARGYTQLAKELGITTVEVANSANEWARQGYEAEQANQLIVASSKLAKLGMISTTEATKDLTSAIKGFKLSTEDAMSVVDKLTKIDQVAAISAGNLAEGLARVSTTAQQAGLSLDETAAMVTTITEVTQRDASTAGEALRTLISRYSNVKAGVFTSMGEEAEETSGNINDIEKVLGKLGIRIRTSGTEMRSIEDVLDELAEKWDTLDDVSRNAVASAFAGVRQRESFNILLSNWDRVKELTEESANAAGTADEKYSAYMDSMEAATKRLQNAWEGFTQLLETSTVMKFLTNSVALLVENADKLKYIITVFAAASSAKIFDFFTNKGETGGFKGLIANIPFIGRGTKTNNILESIDKKVGVIQGEVQKDKSGITRNGGLISRIKEYNQMKRVARGELVSNEDLDEIETIKASYDYDEDSYKNAVSKYKKNRQKEAQEALAKSWEQRKTAFAQTAAVSGIATLATQLMTTKQVSGYGQTVEETGGDKALRTGLATAGSVAGAASALIPAIGPVIAPLISSLGSIAGEGLAGLIAKWFHKDELQMKQRVADAKENLSALGDIKSAIENNEDLLSRDTYTSKDLEKLKLYVDSLRKSFVDNDNLAKSFLDDVKNLEIGTFTTIEDVLSQIADGNADINKQLKRQLELTTARLTVENTLSEQEEDRKKIQEYVGKKYESDRTGINANYLFKDPNDTYYTRSNLLDFYTREDIANLLNTATYTTNSVTYQGKTYSGPEKIDYIQIKGSDIEKVFQNAQKILEEVRKSYSETNKNLVSEWETIVNNLSKQLDSQKKLNAELLSTQVDYAYLTSDILNTKSRDEIRDLGMEGVVKIIRDELISLGVGVVDEQGVIHQDAYDAIVKKIRSDSTLSDYITKDIRSIGDLISKDDIRGIEAFARAFGLTTEAAKELGKQFGYLTQSMGLMNVQETTEYYEKLSTVFSNLSSNVALTAGQINSLLTTSELKDLLPYLMNQDDPDALIKELYKRIYGGGQDVHIENALYDATMGMSTDKFREYLQNKGLKEYVAEIDKGGYTTLSQIRDAVKEFDETDPRRQAFLEYLETINYTYSKDLTALEKPSEYIKSQLEEQINNLQEQKDALSQINDEREKELNLIKAKQALEDARKEKRRVYRAGVGFVMESNEGAIAEAQKNLENLNTQKRQESLQMQIDALQMQKNIIEALPNQAQLEQTKKIWELWAEDKGVKGSLASVSEGVAMLADAYSDATKEMNVASKTLEKWNTPEEESGQKTSEEKTNPLIKLSESQIEYTKALVGTVEDILALMLSPDDNADQFLKIYNLIKGLDDFGAASDFDQFLVVRGLYTTFNKLSDKAQTFLRSIAPKKAIGDVAFSGGKTLINELGTEAVITPGGTLTALPSKTGIVPADITRNVWALGEVAPTLVAQLGSLTQKIPTGNAGNTTYEEGQYFDNFTMNVYPAKGDDFNKILEQARAQMRLTRHNN